MRGASRLVLLCVAVQGTVACSGPDAPPPPPAYAFSDTQQTSLGRGVARALDRAPAPSGFRLLGGGREALAARIALIDAAERSVDVQYYLYHADRTTALFTDALLRAADRGVRVRLLLDDFGIQGQRRALAVLSAHPRLEVRLFNPLRAPVLPRLDLLLRFPKATRRMHNKVLLVDNQASVIGGRNIGDSYFAATPRLEFGDLDLLAVGRFTRNVSDSFDLYWNHRLAVPVGRLQSGGSPEALVRLRQRLVAELEDPQLATYRRSLPSAESLFRREDGRSPLAWARADLVVDAPDKLLQPPSDPTGHLAPELSALLADASTEVFLVSPYFVPGREMTDRLIRWAEAGGRVVVLTNSLASTDVPAVHGGYLRYRRRLLEAGIEVWELKPRHPGSGPSSVASLHAKALVVDRRKLFVGSLNLDPRSIRLNTEIGAVVHAPELARSVAEGLERDLEPHAWRLTLEAPGDGRESIAWVDRGASAPDRVLHAREPEANPWRRFQAWLFRLLPLESQL